MSHRENHKDSFIKPTGTVVHQIDFPILKELSEKQKKLLSKNKTYACFNNECHPQSQGDFILTSFEGLGMIAKQERVKEIDVAFEFIVVFPPARFLFQNESAHKI